MSKRKSMRKHAKERFAERFGIELNQEKRRTIVDMIRNGKATLIVRQTNRVSLLDVAIDHQVIRVAYDRRRGELITAMWPTIVPRWIDYLEEPPFSDTIEEIDRQIQWNGVVRVRCRPA